LLLLQQLRSMLRGCIFHAELSWASLHPLSLIPV
jgi:hypothetical protein